MNEIDRRRPDYEPLIVIAGNVAEEPATQPDAGRVGAPCPEGGHAQERGDRRLTTLAEENTLLVFTLGSFALLLLVLTPQLLVGDSWMTLVAGREIWDQGFTREETLTVLGHGRDWIDQQWGAQVAFYAMEQLGGLRLVILLNVALIVAAYSLAAAAARQRGASVRATLIITGLVILAAPWAWQVRAQALALPLFTGLLWLLAAGQRRPGRHELLVLPLLVVWANAHGTVVLGAALAVAAGAIHLARRRGEPWVAGALVLLPPLSVLASPYALDLPAYYHLMLLDPPFAGLILEWRPTGVEAKTVLFFVLAGAALVLALWQRRRLTLFEAFALALTFYVGIDAIRGVIWFALTCLVVLPFLLDGARGLRDPPPHFPRFNRMLTAAWIGVVAVGAAVVATRASSWYESEWPTNALPVVAQQTTDTSARVYPISRYADWLLWKQPSLRGRIAYDVRFEIYPRPAIERLANFASHRGEQWGADANGYSLLVLDTRKHSKEQWRAGLARTRVVYEEPGILVLAR